MCISVKALLSENQREHTLLRLTHQNLTSLQTVIKYSVILIIAVAAMHVNAQTCDSNYFSIIYKTRAYNSFTKAVVTPKNETITLGNLTYPRGWISKITAQGSVVWSNEYTPNYKANNEETLN